MQISPAYRPTVVPYNKTFLIVYRKLDYEVGFMELNLLSARLLEKIAGNDEKTGKEMLLEICQEIDHPDQAVVVSGGAEILNNFRDKFVLLGTTEKGEA